MAKLKFFISYAREDVKSAIALTKYLKEKKFDPWFDQDSLECGDEWEREIDRKINECDYFIALLSNNSLSNERFFKKEKEIALHVHKNRGTAVKFILPARVEDCDPTDSDFADFHRIDLFPSLYSGTDKLLKELESDTIKAELLDVLKKAAPPTYRIARDILTLSAAIKVLFLGDEIQLPDAKIIFEPMELPEEGGTLKFLEPFSKNKKLNKLKNYAFKNRWNYLALFIDSDREKIGEAFGKMSSRAELLKAPPNTSIACIAVAPDDELKKAGEEYDKTKRIEIKETDNVYWAIYGPGIRGDSDE